MTEPFLAANDLTRTFGGAFTLGPATFALAPGETVGFLGKNGAGKSTLFQLLTGNLDASGGEVRLAGHKLSPDHPELKRRIGYLPQNPVLPRWVTGREILTYAARLYGLPEAATRVAAAERYWDCADFAHKPLQALSYGMQKRVSLALATLHDPDGLILDEPHSGLDLFHVKALDDAIARRAAAGKTTLLSTHVASFAATLCQRVFVIDAGKVTALTGWEDRPFLDRIARIESAFFGPAGDAR